MATITLSIIEELSTRSFECRFILFDKCNLVVLKLSSLLHFRFSNKKLKLEIFEGEIGNQILELKKKSEISFNVAEILFMVQLIMSS